MKEFDVDAALDEGYSKDEINAFLKSRPDLKPSYRPPWILESKAIPIAGGVIGGATGAIPGVLAGGAPAALTAPAGAAAGYGGADVIRRVLIDLLGYKSPTEHTLASPPKGVVEAAREIGTGPAVSALAAYPINKLLPYLVGAIPGASNIAGKLLEKATSRASVPMQRVEEKLGTTLIPNPALYERASSAGGRSALADMIRKEITALGQGRVLPTGEISKDIPLLEILKNRIGAYSQGSSTFLQKIGAQQASPKQKVFASLGKAYSDIIHKEIPQTKVLDAIISASKKVGLATKGLGGAALLKAILGQGQKEAVSTIVDMTD